LPLKDYRYSATAAVVTALLFYRQNLRGEVAAVNDEFRAGDERNFIL
jgi:hypothetical protein